MRILHIVHSLQFGGLEQFAVRIAAAQRDRDHDVAILAFRDGALAENARALGITVFILKEIPISLGKLGGIPRFLQMMTAVTRFRPDILHAHNPTSIHYDVMVKSFTGAKLVLTDHGQCAGPECAPNRLPKPGEVARIDTVISVSKDVEDRHLNIYRPAKHRMVILNGVDPRLPQRTSEQVRHELGLDSNLTGVVVARVDSIKDHDTMLEAFSALQAKGHALNLIIVGDGTERTRLEARLPSLGLSPQRIRFVGFRQDVPDMLAAADFFVLSSLQEGLPLAMLEAMSQKLPVVATKAGGIPELIAEGEHGYLVPLSRPDLLADAIAKLVPQRDIRRRMGETGAAHVLANYSFTRMVDRYDDMYRKLLSPRPDAGQESVSTLRYSDAKAATAPPGSSDRVQR